LDNQLIPASKGTKHFVSIFIYHKIQDNSMAMLKIDMFFTVFYFSE